MIDLNCAGQLFAELPFGESITVRVSLFDEQAEEPLVAELTLDRGGNIKVTGGGCQVGAGPASFEGWLPLLALALGFALVRVRRQRARRLDPAAVRA